MEAAEQLHAALRQALAEPAFAGRMGEMGLALAGGEPAAFGRRIAEETERWRKEGGGAP